MKLRFSSSLTRAVALYAIALVARLGCVAWAAGTFGPAGDGVYYARLGDRIAHGYGSTWLWPDGVVTYAAHYPVGYPALLGALWWVVGPSVTAAMLMNAVLGALAAPAVDAIARRATFSRAGWFAGLAVALHPALVAYTPALMTEGVTATLFVSAAALAALAREAETPWRAKALLAALGFVLGLATLMRPQSLLLAPLLGALVWVGRSPDPTRSSTRWTAARRAGVGAALVTSLALVTCAPWTVRNCVRMQRCALVSFNGGWNLLIGADEASTGAWSPIQVPDRCREVWDEAEKDACFGREARRFIAERPVTWLSLVPRKLAATFDYCGAAGWYLHESNHVAFEERAKVILGAVETIATRLLLLASIVGLLRHARTDEASRRRLSGMIFIGVVGAVFAMTEHAWVSFIVLVAMMLAQPKPLARQPMLLGSAAAVIASTIATHAVFFGAGRYSLVTFPALCALASLAWPKRPVRTA